MKAPFVLVAELVPDMVVRGAGAVINVSTMVSNFGPHGVRVNAVSPGPTRTEGNVAMGDGLDQLASTTPAGRPGAADDVAAAIVFLASLSSQHIHGAILPVDGGRLAV